MPRRHIFGGLLWLLLLSTEFSLYSAMHATDGMDGMAWGASFLIQPPRCSLWVADQEGESYQRITRRPLLHHCCPVGWAPCLYSARSGVQDGCFLVHFHPDPLPNEPTCDCSLVADGQHGSVIQPSVWPVLLASPPYPDTSQGNGFQGTYLLGCWP